MSHDLRILALASYPELGPSTRHRILPYVPLLAEAGISVDVRPFLTNPVFAGLYDKRQALRSAAGVLAGVGRRVADAVRLGRYDLVFVQREAALIGPPLLEWLAHRRLPMILDLDDANYLDRPSDVYGSLVGAIKWRGKTTQLIRWADHVTCGNPSIASYVQGYDVPATIVPTIVDVDRYTPRRSRQEGELVLGWIGSHSTFAYFRTLLPVLRRLARSHRFHLRVIGAGPSVPPVDGLDAEMVPWRLDRELADLQSFDVAVYPIVAGEWAEGKSGFKAIQYLSCGIPYVASPVGVVGQIGIPGTTHLEARTEDEWFNALSTLVTNAALRDSMARQGRAYAVAHFSIEQTAATLANLFRQTVEQRRTKN
jgi:glycosyltransferase involved in cell wall biosynthesis